VETELLYNRLNPFFWARVLLFAGFLFFLFSLKNEWQRLKIPAMAGLIGGLLFFTLGMAMRAYIGGRAPWSNMYESLLAIGWTVVLISIIFELVRRDRIFGLSGALMGWMILALAHYASLDRGINQLVPALQSNWLIFHTLTVLMSYACFAIAMVIGHGVLIAAVRNKGQLNNFISRMVWADLKIVQLGSVLLILGILLGAVWANVSWGRFWGWDPKETWALISWFAYIILLHGRSAGWLSWRGFAVSTVAAFPIIVMTYYGVNFFLSGLHSYGAGSSPGIPWQAFAYLGFEILFLTWALMKLRGTQPPRPMKKSSGMYESQKQSQQPKALEA
jgi:cytochrome c-type biogenesis protein CcsB